MWTLQVRVARMRFMMGPTRGSRDLCPSFPRDALPALLIVFVWGTNFVVVRWGLDMLPPLMMAAIRFALVLFPAIFLPEKAGRGLAHSRAVRLLPGNRPVRVCLLAMDGFISPGMASVVMQMQVFFTIAIAAQRTGEKPKLHQMLGLVPAAAELILILTHNGEDITPAGLALVLGGAACWGISNQAARSRASGARGRGHPMNPLAFVVWASLFAMPGLLMMSLLLEGPGRVSSAVPPIESGRSGRPWCGRARQIPCSDIRCGPGCCRSIRRHKLPPCRCWCR